MTLRAGEVYRSPLYDRVDRRAAFTVWAGHLPEGSNLEVVVEHKDRGDATLVHAGSLCIHDAAVHMSVCSGIKEQYRYRCTFTSRLGETFRVPEPSPIWGDPSEPEWENYA